MFPDLIKPLFKYKLWEILLFVAVLLLAALVYEVHNDGGRYVTIERIHVSWSSQQPADSEGAPAARALLDTRTGKVWVWDTDKWVIRQPAIPKGF